MVFLESSDKILLSGLLRNFRWYDKNNRAYLNIWDVRAVFLSNLSLVPTLMMLNPVNDSDEGRSSCSCCSMIERLNTYVIISMLVLSGYPLRQNEIKKIQSLLSSPRRILPVLRMVQTRRSSALNDLDADSKSDRPEPPSKKVKVSKDSGTPEYRVTANLLSIPCKTQPPIHNMHQRHRPKVRIKPHFEIALTVLGKLEHMYHRLEGWKMQSQMLLP